MPIPLYGEQVLLISAIPGDTTSISKEQYFYISNLNTHGQVNNSILPFVQDREVSGRGYMPDAISKTAPGTKPNQLSFKEVDITYIQPFQGDILQQDRFGSALRFSSTHKQLDAYQKKPFWTGNKQNDPFLSLTCGIKDAMTGRSISKYYSIEDPTKDASYIYLTSSQKFKSFKLSQSKVGAGVDPLNMYTKPQVIIGSDRLIFNAKKDELILTSKKDVKIATPKWQVDMDEFFTLFDELLQEMQKVYSGMHFYNTPMGGPTLPNPAATSAIMQIISRYKQMTQGG